MNRRQLFRRVAAIAAAVAVAPSVAKTVEAGERSMVYECCRCDWRSTVWPAGSQSGLLWAAAEEWEHAHEAHRGERPQHCLMLTSEPATYRYDH